MYLFEDIEQFGINKSELVMTLNVVFDESGKHNDCEVIVFGGLIFKPSEVTSTFNRRWTTLLRGSKLPLPTGPFGPFLHMTELNNLYKGADSTTQAKIMSLVKSLTQSVCDSALGASFSSITVGQFNAIPQKNKKRYKDPFYYAFEHGLRSLSKDDCLDPADDLTLICDDSNEAGMCLESFRRLKRLEPSIAEKFAVIAFGDDKRYPPLQAADMVAYCRRASLSSPEDGLWAIPHSMILGTFSQMTTDDIKINEEGTTLEK